MAASAVSLLVKTLGPLIQKEVVLLWGVEEDMRKLFSTLSTILDVLDDAEMRQHQNKPLENWLRKLKDAAYMVRDILNECETEALKWEIKHQSSSHLKKVWSSAITYPVVNLYFRHQIGNRMKDITEHINHIAEERKRFHLNEGFIGNGPTLADDSRETSSALPPLELFGRQDDIERIVKVLTKDVCDLEEFSVYPIIGMGGLGKTTLAQMTFNDERITSHFELKIWIYVSQSFDVKQVMKRIIEASTPGENYEASTLEYLQRKAKDMLSRKRYLLVLDDAWSEDQEEWDKLKPSLACGLPGACLVVTTRSEKVASLIGTLPTHYLLPLSEDDCWLLFRQRAFGPGNEERPDLVDIGKEIVKKCGGVPLAAKALGGLMRFRRGEEEWHNVADSNLWDIPEDKCSILPALRLSFYNLPLELRHCFSYCAVFLKGAKIDKENLIHHWMAHGFISSNRNIEVEDVGNQIWNELYTRSFFQEEDKDWRGRIYFEMHDLMHDLAHFVMQDECQVVEAETSSSVITPRIRHATLIQSGVYGYFPKALKTQCSLHTIRFEHRDPTMHSEFEKSWGLENFCSLRVLDADWCGMKKLSGSVGNSKHLRYLNLSRTRITELPASICGLPNLQTLNLNDCYWLQKLPNKMNKLRSLRHLCLRKCYKVDDMPPELGKLTQLKTLSFFVVGENNGKRLGELQHLNDLGGNIEIKHLERGRNSMEAKEANLAGKPNLRMVKLSWEKSLEHLDEEQEQVIEALEPHPNVAELTIEYYRDNKLPMWMGNPSILENVVSIKIHGCRSCLRLPEFWQLPRLERLDIGGMEKVEYIMIQDGNSSGGFPSLKHLEIVDLPNLKGLVSMDEEEEKTEEQRREHPQLTSIILPALESLEIKKISMNVNILTSISKLTTLTTLFLISDEDLVCFPDDMFQKLPRLQTLKIFNFTKLKTLPGNMSSLVTLKELWMQNCKELETLPDGGIGSLTSLLNLRIIDCPKIVSLPDSIQTLTQLQSVHLFQCPLELERRCEKGKGEDWYKIAHVPQLRIWGRTV